MSSDVARPTLGVECGLGNSFDAQIAHGFFLAVLLKAGFQAGQKALFLWEGVTMYLSAQAVDSTLNFNCSRAAPGSRLAFDYIYALYHRRLGEKLKLASRNLLDKNALIVV